jgi:hypothetical protein
MRKHLRYTEPSRSIAGAWKHGYSWDFKSRRHDLKHLGKMIANSGVMTKPLDPVKITKFCIQIQTVSSKFGDAWGYSARNMLVVLMGSPDLHDMFHTTNENFSSGYTSRERWSHVVWADEDWFTNSPYAYVHALHQAVDNPANVAYAESFDKMKLGRYTSTKAGRYLTKFFGGADGVLTEPQIKYWAERQAARACPAELRFIEGTDKDGWVRVYKDGPQSCMQGEDCVQVYAHKKSVLRLAYLTQGEEIHARCIVREDKKEYIRCYPNGTSTENTRWQTAMQEAVEDAGYTHGNFHGVHLDKVRYDGASRYENKWVMPYLDNGSGRRCDTYVDDAGDTLVVGSEGVEAQQQSGYVDFDNQAQCDECSDRISEDEGYYIDSEEITVCEHCYNNNFVSALGRRGNDVMIRADNAVEVGGNYYDPDYLSENDIYMCEASEEYYHVDDLCSTSRGYVHNDSVTALDEEDSDGNTHAHDDDISTTHDGRVIHEDDAVTETVNGEDVVFHKDDDIAGYRAEHEEEDNEEEVKEEVKEEHNKEKEEE